METGNVGVPLLPLFIAVGVFIVIGAGILAYLGNSNQEESNRKSEKEKPARVIKSRPKRPKEVESKPVHVVAKQLEDVQEEEPFVKPVELQPQQPQKVVANKNIPKPQLPPQQPKQKSQSQPQQATQSKNEVQQPQQHENQSNQQNNKKNNSNNNNANKKGKNQKDQKNQDQAASKQAENNVESPVVEENEPEDNVEGEWSMVDKRLIEVESLRKRVQDLEGELKNAKNSVKRFADLQSEYRLLAQQKKTTERELTNKIIKLEKQLHAVTTNKVNGKQVQPPQQPPHQQHHEEVKENGGENVVQDKKPRGKKNKQEATEPQEQQAPALTQ